MGTSATVMKPDSREQKFRSDGRTLTSLLL